MILIKQVSLIASVFSVTIFFLVVIVVNAHAAGQPNEVTTLTEKDDGKSITMPAGGKLEIRLPVQLSTGYNWKVVKLDDQVISSSGKPETKFPDKPMPGSPELLIFSFKALKAGTTDIEFHYLRPWEKDTAPIKTFKVSVTIK